LSRFHDSESILAIPGNRFQILIPTPPLGGRRNGIRMNEADRRRGVVVTTLPCARLVPEMRRDSSRLMDFPWHPDEARAVLDLPGPWPTVKTKRTEAFEPLDVDHYGNFALVLGHVTKEEPPGFASRCHVLFRLGPGGWESRGGGGGGGGDAFEQRSGRAWADRPFALECGGWSFLGRDAPGLCSLMFLSAPNVATVVVDRREALRRVEVSRGPGFVCAVWVQGDEPTITFLDSVESKLDVLDAVEVRRFVGPHPPPATPPRRRTRRLGH